MAKAKPQRDPKTGKVLFAVPTPRRPKPATAQAAAESAPPSLEHITPGLRALARPLADLAFLAENAVDHPDEQIEDLRALLLQRGQLEPLVINRGTVIGGNGRLRALLAMNVSHAACVEIDVDEATAEQIALELNRSSEGRVYNRANLDAVLARVKAAKVELSPRVQEMMSRLRAERGTRPVPLPASPKTNSQETSTPPTRCPACGHEWHS